MIKFLKSRLQDNIMGKIFVSYAIAAISCGTIFYWLVPIILNYAPGYSYIDELHGLNYTVQFIIMVLGALLVGYFIIFFCLKGVKEVEEYLKNPQENMPVHIQNMKRKLLHLPYLIYAVQIAVPAISMMILILPMFILEQASLFVFFRVFIMLIGFFVLVSIITLVVSQRAFKKLLLKIDSHSHIDGKRIPMKTKLYVEVLSIFIIAILFTSLIGYSNNVRDKGDLICESYITLLNDTFDKHKDEVLSVGEIKQLLDSVRNVDGITDSRFIIDPNGNITTSDGKELGGYFITYLYELSQDNGGYVYDVTEETRGVITKVKGPDGIYTVGIKFNIASFNLFVFYGISFIFIILLCSLVLYFLSNAITEDVLTVASSLSEIASGDYESLNHRLPVTSNDETSDLIMAFNRIQVLVQDYIKQIRKNHEVLIQSERLVSLGQLIGGIAHSLKTPISTASDATFCINNLVKEYEESIDNEMVTKKDHHEIASEIKTHVNDLKETLDYINNIINTVKNHAADFDKGREEKFAIKDLINGVSILMSNELKKNSCKLHIETNMADDDLLDGDMRSLIQIIDVLISNAIQAYPQGNGQIDFMILKSDNFVQIIVQDYGIGIPKNIQESILNKMVTTKGSKGTGIGLYISNSIVKAKFDGSLSFESVEGEGTKFKIILPRKKEE